MDAPTAGERVRLCPELRVIWAVSLGSGTSGRVLAPLLLMGGALGAAAQPLRPPQGAGFWPLVAMGAVLGGTMRSPLTAVVFAVELTGNVWAILPLLVAVTLAHGVTVLLMGRSILTEKVSRRGYHLRREYAVDPLEILFVSKPSAAASGCWRCAWAAWTSTPRRGHFKRAKPEDISNER
jgi:hypothetical protein